MLSLLLSGVDNHLGAVQTLQAHGCSPRSLMSREKEATAETVTECWVQTGVLAGKLKWYGDHTDRLGGRKKAIRRVRKEVTWSMKERDQPK